MVRAGIIGASGYAGAEVARYLLAHPGVQIAYLASESLNGKPLSAAYPSFLGQDLPLCDAYDLDKAADCTDVVFQTNKDLTGMRIAPQLLDAGIKMVDVPADFRLKDPATYAGYYGAEHTATQLLAEAVYGVPELHAEQIARARLVANPGCYATGAVLALAPLVSIGTVHLDSIIIDAKSGVSGAGRSKLKVASMFCEINEGFKAYAVSTHVHTPEIEQELSVLAGRAVTVSFTPHLIPMNRGILTTAYAAVASRERQQNTAEMVELYREFYKKSRFVIVLDEGSQPNTKDVCGTNYCHVGVVSDSRTGRVIVTSAIDNMGKGAAGQAVQNMNLMCGFDEAAGLSAPAVYP